MTEKTNHCHCISLTILYVESNQNVIPVIITNQELLEACAISGNLTTQKKSIDDKILDTGEGDSDDENEDDI